MNTVTKARISISVTRVNGRIDNIGCIQGGEWYEMIIPRIKLWFANRRTRRGK